MRSQLFNSWVLTQLLVDDHLQISIVMQRTSGAKSYQWMALEHKHYGLKAVRDVSIRNRKNMPAPLRNSRARLIPHCNLLLWLMYVFMQRELASMVREYKPTHTKPFSFA